MTNKEILKLAIKVGFSLDKDDGTWFCLDEELLKFARELYDEGYTKGFEVGHDAGWELNDEVSRRGL